MIIEKGEVLLLELLQTVRIGKPILGILMSLLILLISLTMSWFLYRHFSKNL